MLGRSRNPRPNAKLQSILGMGLLLIGGLLLAVFLVYWAYPEFSRVQARNLGIGRPVAVTLLHLYGAQNGYDEPIGFSGFDVFQPVGPHVAPQFWDNPSLAETIDDKLVIGGFNPVDSLTASKVYHHPPSYIRIPSIDISSPVESLSILDLGNSKSYETPKDVVGYIPESAIPGSLGNVWLFGHLESPIRGEGSVFNDLPKINELLRQGRSVFVILQTPGDSFLYLVKSFRLIPKEELYFWGSDRSQITLVTCWPRFSYDQRIVITAELVGLK